MAESLAAVVLAAGAGTRLAPLTRLRPKALCPVGNVALLDRALGHVLGAVVDEETVAVNVHHGRSQIQTHLEARFPQVHISIEEHQALGTAGALGHLRDWLDGRPVLVVNADTWSSPALAAFVDGWDGERIRILVAGEARFGSSSRIVAALHPAEVLAGLRDEPSGLYEACWRAADARGALEPVGYDGPFVDCATPADYLRANLLVSGGASVIGEGAEVRGRVLRSVLWPGVVVHRDEELVQAIRASADVTVLVR